MKLPMMTRRAALTTLALALSGDIAGARGLSDRPVTIVVPYSAGTGIDICARIIAEQLQRRWLQPIVVENKPGASGNIGTTYAAARPADGHALLMVANTFVSNVSLFKALTYDPQRSFTPIVLVATGALALAVHPDVPARSAQEFIAHAKARAGQINYGSPGRGTPQHLAMELFKQTAKVELTHVPYTGSAGVVRDLVGGHVSAMFIPVHTVLPLARDGQVRILALGSATRSALAPDVPTLPEAGVEGFSVDLWYALLAPVGLPLEIAIKINADVNAILGDKNVRETFEQQGLITKGGAPDELTALVASDQVRWTGVVKAAGLSAE